MGRFTIPYTNKTYYFGVPCPECQMRADGILECTENTYLGVIPWNDEFSNRLHWHDENDMFGKQSCANGHEFEGEIRGQCWCGWSKPR